MSKTKTLTFKQAINCLIEELNKAHSYMNKNESGSYELAWNITVVLNRVLAAHLNGEEIQLRMALKEATMMKSDWITDPTPAHLGADSKINDDAPTESKPTDWRNVVPGTKVLFRRSKDSEYEVAVFGGAAYYGADAGAFFWSVYSVSGFLNRLIGARVAENGEWHVDPHYLKLA